MALPFRRQQLAKFIPFHDHTAKTFAEAVSSRLSEGESVSTADIVNFSHGRKYPSAREIRAIELALGGLPIQTLLEARLIRAWDRDLRLECES